MFKKIFALGITISLTITLSGCFTSYNINHVSVENDNKSHEPEVVSPAPIEPPIIVVLPAPKPPVKLIKPRLRKNNLNDRKLRSSAGTNSRGTHSRNGIRKNRRNSRS